jgi:RNA polymerase sigma-70 factor (ECF subfamily)
VDERERLKTFEQTVLPHLDAAYNLARWLTGNDHDAQDVTQEASLRAFKFFGSFRGENARAWLLTIVRNTFYNWLQKNRPAEMPSELNDEALAVEDISVNAESVNLRIADAAVVRRAIGELPVEFREIVVLREMEGFSYKEIADLSMYPSARSCRAWRAHESSCKKVLPLNFKTEVKNELPAGQTAH